MRRQRERDRRVPTERERGDQRLQARADGARPKRSLRILRADLGSADVLPTLPPRVARLVPRRYTAA